MSNGYYGQQAVEEAARHFNFKGPIDPVAAHVIMEEGFVPAIYKDDVGVETFGVGQTKEYLDKDFFTEVFPAKEREVKKKIPGYDGMGNELKAAVMSAHYRGDLGPKTVKLLNEGKFEEAAKEYLNHGEYRKRRAKDKDDGVVQRMERNARAMWQAARG
jgi:GH24 family phage-related lysozyme (muramidase)